MTYTLHFPCLMTFKNQQAGFNSPDKSTFDAARKSGAGIPPLVLDGCNGLTLGLQSYRPCCETIHGA